MGIVIVHKGRTTIITVSLGFDVSKDVLTSEIRASEDPASELIATWDVVFTTDGVDGELTLTLDDEARAITKRIGYMDIKRITGGASVSLFDQPLEVAFKESITV